LDCGTHQKKIEIKTFFGEFNRYILKMKFSPKILSASYNSKHNHLKDLFNQKVCSTMIKQNVKKRVLLLDGINIRSTKACEAIGITRKSITTIERDPDVSAAHLSKGLYCYQMDVQDVFAKPNIYKPYNTINLDVVNSAPTICKYIKNVFANSFLSKQSVFALTITKRSGIKGTSYIKDYLDLKKLIKKYSSFYGYKAKIEHEHTQPKVVSIIYSIN